MTLQSSAVFVSLKTDTSFRRWTGLFRDLTPSTLANFHIQVIHLFSLLRVKNYGDGMPRQSLFMPLTSQLRHTGNNHVYRIARYVLQLKSLRFLFQGWHCMLYSVKQRWIFTSVYAEKIGLALLHGTQPTYVCSTRVSHTNMDFLSFEHDVIACVSNDPFIICYEALTTGRQSPIVQITWLILFCHFLCLLAVSFCFLIASR